MIVDLWFVWIFFSSYLVFSLLFIWTKIRREKTPSIWFIIKFSFIQRMLFLFIPGSDFCNWRLWCLCSYSYLEFYQTLRHSLLFLILIITACNGFQLLILGGEADLSRDEMFVWHILDSECKLKAVKNEWYILIFFEIEVFSSVFSQHAPLNVIHVLQRKDSLW